MAVVARSAAILFLIAFQIGLDILQKLLSFDIFSFFTQLGGGSGRMTFCCGTLGFVPTGLSPNNLPSWHN